MNYEALIKSMMSNTAKLTDKEKENALNRGAVSQIPLSVGDVISFTPDLKVMYVDINGTQTPMVVGTLSDTFDETAEPARISLVSFGRHFFNPQTKKVTKPADIAETGTDVTKLTYNVFKDVANLGEIPALLAGKTLKVRGIEQFASINADGTKRLSATQQPMFTTVTAYEFQ